MILTLKEAKYFGSLGARGGSSFSPALIHSAFMCVNKGLRHDPIHLKIDKSDTNPKRCGILVVGELGGGGSFLLLIYSAFMYVLKGFQHDTFHLENDNNIDQI